MFPGEEGHPPHLADGVARRRRQPALHLWRVQDHKDQNRMTVPSLAICFAPTMMGGAKDLGRGQDTALQTRVVQTVLENTFMIFDED